MFTVDQGGWMQDVALLDRMMAENLSEAAHEIVKEGWKWIEAAADLPMAMKMAIAGSRARPSR